MASMLDAGGINQGLPAKLSDGIKPNTDLSKRGASLSAGPNSKRKNLAAPWSETWPTPGATLDLDFANDRGFVRGVGQGKAMNAVTFTRASSATYVGADGLLKGSGGYQGALGKNLLTFPQDFDNAVWIANNTSLFPNVIPAPDGTNTADLLRETTVNGVHYIRCVGNATGVVTTASIYVKAAGRNFAYLYSAGNTATGLDCRVNLTTGSVTNNMAETTVTTADAGNGWWRIKMTMTGTYASSVAFFFLVGPATEEGTGTPTYTGDGISGIYIWGAQLELGSTATTYYPTNINTPRFDWASTTTLNSNLIASTEDFDNAAWTKSNSTASTTAGVSTIQQIGGLSSVVTGTSQTMTYAVGDNIFTALLKGDGSRYVRISFGNLTGVTNGAVDIDLQTNTVTSGTATVVSAADGYSLVTIVLKTLATDIAGNLAFTILESPGDPTWTTTSTSVRLLVKEPQITAGAVATPYKAVGAQVPTNTPLGPASTCNGLLIEESRANRILWCRDATQANWTCTNVTPLKDQTGIDGVANAASSLTASADGGTCIQTITLASGSRTGSVYLKRITGTGDVQVSLDGSTWSTVDLSSTEWRRIVLSGTVTNPTVGIKLATNGDAVAMDYAQVEDNTTNGGTLATSPIFTASESATRAGDFASLSGPNFYNWFRYTPVTLYAEAIPYCSGDQVASVFLTNTANVVQSNSIYKVATNAANAGTTWISQSYAAAAYFVMSNSLAQASVLSKSKIAYSFSGWYGAIAANGIPGSLTRNSFIGDHPLSVRAWIGCRNDGLQLNGAVSRVSFFNKKMTESQLIEMTR